MSQLSTKISSFFLPFLLIVALLGLVACGGQGIKPEETGGDERAETTAPADVAPADIVANEAQKTEPAPEPEPVVEISSRKEEETVPIAVESMPAADTAEAVMAPAESKPKTAPESPSVAEPESPASQPTAPMEAEVPVVAAPEVEPAPESKPTAVPEAVQVPADPYHFVVTVGPKQPSHPAYGKGHSLGFIVNGVSGKELVIERGKVYTFEILTDPKHDVYLSKKAIGWGSAPYSAGVEGAYTYKGTITFKADKSTPDQLFYACRNHPYMGGVIHVVDPGQTVDVSQQAAATKAAGGAVASKATTVTAGKVKQKLMFAEMMAGAQGTKRVLASQNDEAKQLVMEAKKSIIEGHEKSQVGALPEALTLANQALKMLSEAARLVPGDEELALMAENYKSMLAEIQDYQKSYHANIKRLEKSGGVTDDVHYDEKEFAETLNQAKAFAEKKNYLRANKLLQQAQATVTGALHKMLDSKTIVYDLKFDTPADEYEYELKRFTGYEELIPVAIEAKKPAPGAIKLMESFLDKARKRRDEAKAKAEEGDYPTAIAMLLQATKTVRRALRMVGVSQ